MNLGVCNQVRLPRESFSAHCAGKRRLSSVQSHMSQQCSLLQELLATNITSVWHSAMESSMIDQLELSLEGGAAVVADKWM